MVKKNGVPEIENVFDDGTVALFVVRPDGTLETACDGAVFDRTHAGAKGSTHAHSANFDPSGRFVLACDAGAGDLICIYRVDPGSRTFAQAKVYKDRPDTSPRHHAFHRRLPYVFVIHERESSIASYHFDSKTGDISLIQTCPGGFHRPERARRHPHSSEREIRLRKQSWSR